MMLGQRRSISIRKLVLCWFLRNDYIILIYMVHSSSFQMSSILPIVILISPGNLKNSTGVLLVSEIDIFFDIELN